ncbi:MAG TPA: GNAT family N-acetyltransferase [Pyrinomonadaceae bacterium]|nr:GNAT family N-acetyltransferase [Pyrinomonadaceae bacterium]
MALTMMQRESAPDFQNSISPSRPVQTQPLTQHDWAEVEWFLTDRPLHTVYLSSLIRDNGVVSPLNRGTFYGCRKADGQLAGVALLGHATIFETGNEECIKAFAHLAKSCALTHLIRGEQDKVECFWHHYAPDQHAVRLVSRELLLERKTTPTDFEPVPDLRIATLGDLDLIANANAAMALHESGVNPLTKDRKGFYERVGRRISQKRIWVLVEEGHLIFKTDIIAETAHAAYLEGVYVAPEKRGQGYGLKCISQLTHLLLSRTATVCLTVNEKFPRALTFYQRAGYSIASSYDTIYLHN